MRATGAAALLTLALAVPASAPAAEWQVSLYSGSQGAADSTVSGNDNGTPFRFTAGWEGRPTAAPPYWGLRATRWDGDWGWGAEFTHAKVYADDATLAASGFSTLEFTDGLNIATVNLARRWPGAGRLTPYAGAGLGISVPHVEVQAPTAASKTFEYQLAGPAARAFAGLDIALSGHWSALVEAQATYSLNQASLDGGGRLRTDILTGAVNIGLSYSF